MKTLMLLVVALLASAGCKKKDNGNTAAEAMKTMEELKNKMCACKDAKCAQDVSDEFSKWSQEQAKNQKEPPKLTNEQQTKAAAMGEEMGKCLQTAMGAAAYPPPENLAGSAEGSADESNAGAGSAGAGSAAPAAGADGLPPECAEYRTTVEKLKTCDKIPAKAREALTKAFNDAAAGWANMPDGAKAGLSTSCKAGTQAVVDAAKDACGW